MAQTRNRYRKNWWLADHRGAPGWLIVAAAVFLTACAAMVAMHPGPDARAGSLGPSSSTAWSTTATEAFVAGGVVSSPSGEREGNSAAAALLASAGPARL